MPSAKCHNSCIRFFLVLVVSITFMTIMQRAQDYHTRTAERLKALEVAVLSNLGRMDSVLERAGPTSCSGVTGTGAPMHMYGHPGR